VVLLLAGALAGVRVGGGDRVVVGRRAAGPEVLDDLAGPDGERAAGEDPVDGLRRRGERRELPAAEVGTTAVELLLRRIRERSSDRPRKILIRPELVVRASTAN
jgi:hypothetical protein